MIKDNLNEKIKSALKSKNSDELYVLRMIKAKFLEFETAKNAKPLDDLAEIQILKKMKADWEKELEALENNFRDITDIKNQIGILNSYIPKPPTEHEIKEVIDNISCDITLKNANIISKAVKQIYPFADNKAIVEIIKCWNC